MRLTLAALLLATATAQADTRFDKTVPADAAGIVDVSNTAGRVEVVGTDRNQVVVRGELGAGVERIDVTSEPGHTTIKVILPHHSEHDGDANLHLEVPKGSELHVASVSADQRINGVNGVQRLNAVSGEVITEIAGADLDLKTVSGDVRIKGHGQPARLHVSTVSGDVHLEHGAGELEATSVSGTLVVGLDTARSVHGRTTSGDFHFEGRLGRGASFDVASVSGDLNVRAPGEAGYAFEASSFSGDISDCFNVHPDKDSVVGREISGQRGEGGGHVRLKTMSGDIQLCDRP
ncbi:MAG: DUF4097 family beta strand repeat protein [Gammaproteobacteria bacterium]|nr:DUF4097 family beta strand repeat protein [Gammaproteobacteria bacterium]MBV9695556.1 DUF4097 family beta strand repeat protein [Gammaproteobacteria bacterium]